MARAWHRAKDSLKCGSVNDCIVQTGEPYLLLSGPGWQKVRCARHAGRDVPDVIDEPRPLTFNTPPSFVPARELAKVLPMGPKLIRRDSKLAQTGESE